MKTQFNSLILLLMAGLSGSSQAHDNEQQQTSHTPVFTSLGQGEAVQYAGRPIYHLVNSDNLPSQVALFEEVLPPKSLGAPPHTHTNEDEIFVVLKGKLHFLNGTQEVIADSGTVASLPRHHQHGFWNPYDEPVHLLVFVSPGHFSGFFKAVQDAVKNTDATTPEAVGEVIAQQAQKFGVSIDMSQLPSSALALLKPPPGHK